MFNTYTCEERAFGLRFNILKPQHGRYLRFHQAFLTCRYEPCIPHMASSPPFFFARSATPSRRSAAATPPSACLASRTTPAFCRTKTSLRLRRPPPTTTTTIPALPVPPCSCTKARTRPRQPPQAAALLRSWSARIPKKVRQLLLQLRTVKTTMNRPLSLLPRVALLIW